MSDETTYAPIVSDIKELKQDIKEIKAVQQQTVDKIFLQDNRIQRLESDAGRRKLTEEKLMNGMEVLKDQNALQLLKMETAKAERDTTLRIAKAAMAVGIPVIVTILSGLGWLIQHVGAK